MSAEIVQNFFMALVLFILVTVMLTSCVTNQIIIENEFIPDAYLIQECQDLKPMPIDNMGDLVKIIIKDTGTFNECKEKHKSLIDAYHLYLEHNEEMRRAK